MLVYSIELLSKCLLLLCCYVGLLQIRVMPSLRRNGQTLCADLTVTEDQVEVVLSPNTCKKTQILL